MESVKVGIITAPVGIKGEVRVYPYTDELTRFSDVKNLNVGTESHAVENVRYYKKMVILKLSDVNDRSRAEALRGKELFLEKQFLWDVPEDTYFVKDLVGIQVYLEDGNSIGTLTEVLKGNAQDLYEITTESGKAFLLPAVKEFVLNVDIKKKEMTVRLIEGLAEL